MINAVLAFNRNPYEGTDVAWNEFWVTELLNARLEVNTFFMNDSVDLAHDAATPPEGYFELWEMLKELVKKSVPVKVCGTCELRCGIHRGAPCFEGTQQAKMVESAQWVKQADKVISF